METFLSLSASLGVECPVVASLQSAEGTPSGNPGSSAGSLPLGRSWRQGGNVSKARSSCLLQTGYAGPKDLYQCLPKPRGPSVSIAHHPSEGAPTCPCSVGPEPNLRVVVRIHPFGIHLPRAPGPHWGYSCHQHLSLPHRLPGQKAADKLNTRAKGDESQNNNS